MTQVADSGATRTYQYVFNVPQDRPRGTWSARVLARECTENTVTDLGVGTFEIVQPSLTVQKTVCAVSDPFSGATLPKSIPGAIQLSQASPAAGHPSTTR